MVKQELDVQANLYCVTVALWYHQGGEPADPMGGCEWKNKK